MTVVSPGKIKQDDKAYNKRKENSFICCQISQNSIKLHQRISENSTNNTDPTHSYFKSVVTKNQGLILIKLKADIGNLYELWAFVCDPATIAGC